MHRKSILYIFPHPDDESFGPAPAMHAQLRQGHDVHLLTLTKGEATKQRFRLNISKKEMGNIRYKEMLCVEKVLGLSSMKVLDLPDGKLKEMNPIHLEKVIEQELERLKPDILVTYAVHGISGFLDHLVTHAVVKRVYCSLKERKEKVNRDAYAPSRLALFTRMGETDLKGRFRLEVSAEEDIQFIEQCNSEDMESFYEALACYKTYQEIIEASRVKEVLTPQVPFELFGERYNTRLSRIDEHLN